LRGAVFLIPKIAKKIKNFLPKNLQKSSKIFKKRNICFSKKFFSETCEKNFLSQKI